MNEQPLAIKHWTKEDQPREKLLAKGKKQMTIVELIAILLGTGTRQRSAIQLANDLYFHCDHCLHTFKKMTEKDLKSIRGIGTAKAATLLAAVELCTRMEKTSPTPAKKISSSQDVFNWIKPKIGDLPHEEFWIIYLDRALNIQGEERISSGGISSVLVDPKIVFNKALNKLASQIVLCHNHPSGNLSPSEADRNLTQKLVEAGNLLDIVVTDHIIVTAQSYFSFADEGIL